MVKMTVENASKRSMAEEPKKVQSGQARGLGSGGKGAVSQE
jgi:hypothetical protein